jgi:ubiquinone biosynthesis protein UbiJ
MPVAAVSSQDNGKVTLAVISHQITELTKKQEAFLERFDRHLEQAAGRDAKIMVLTQQLEANCKDTDALEDKVDKLKERSDRNDGLTGILSAAIGMVSAFLINLFGGK